MALKPGMIERFRSALPVLRELQRDIEWLDNEFSPEEATEEERCQVKHLRNLANRPFDEVAWRLERLFMPIEAKGTLFLNSEGRYQIENTDRYFTCGDSCEVFLPFYDDEDEFYTWIPTSIEHQKGDYYFTARPHVKLDGALVRTKK